MSILTRVLLGFVIVAIFPVLYLAAAVLNVNGAWRQKAEQLEAVLATETKAIDELENGDFTARVAKMKPSAREEGKFGIEQREAVRDLLRSRRGRLWYGQITAGTIPGAPGTLQIRIVDAAGDKELIAHGITDKSILYVFKMDHEGKVNPGIEAGKDMYFGEFVVDNLTVDATTKLPANANLPIKPTLAPPQADWEALLTRMGFTKPAASDPAAPAPWTVGGATDLIIYDAMPRDIRGAFYDATEAEIRSWIPAKVVDEYLSDNKEPTAAVLSNPEMAKYVQTVTDESGTEVKRYLRPLRDYREYFREASARAASLSNRIRVLQVEQDYALRALEKTKTAMTALEARKEQLTAEMTKQTAEIAVAQAQAARFQASVADLRKQVEAQLQKVKQLMSPTQPAGTTAAVTVQ